MNRSNRIALTFAATLGLLPAAPVSAQNIHITELPAAVDKRLVKLKDGAYRCDQGRQLQFREVSADAQTAVLQWNQRDYPMRAVGVRSGALRYENAESGLVWLMIPSKSMLLDSRQGQRLADACRT
jgi:hypothetical protein